MEGGCFGLGSRSDELCFCCGLCFSQRELAITERGSRMRRRPWLGFTRHCCGGQVRALQSMAQGGSFTAGFAMGPVHPIAAMELTQTTGACGQIGSISIVSAAGSYGAAVMPFIAVALTNTPGALQTVILVLIATMVATSYALPDRPHGS